MRDAESKLPSQFVGGKQIACGRNTVYRCCSKCGTDIETYIVKTIADNGEGWSSKRCFLYDELCQLIHPNIVRMNRVESDFSGNFYLIMEDVQGISPCARGRDGGMENLVPGLDAHKLSILRDVADALDYIHRCGILHLDVKPANVKIAGDGRAKLLDFDLAARMTDGRAKPRGKGGTPPYMAPEMWRGEELTSATDQWSLAAFAYELISGRLPFSVRDVTKYWSEWYPLCQSWGDYSLSRVDQTRVTVVDVGDEFMQEMAETILHAEVPIIGELSTKANEVLQKALSRHPGDRFDTCMAFIDALAAAQGWRIEVDPTSLSCVATTDGRQHGLNVVGSFPPGAKFFYREKGGGEWLQECPRFSDVGTYNVDVRIEADHCVPYQAEGSIKILAKSRFGWLFGVVVVVAMIFGIVALGLRRINEDRKDAAPLSRQVSTKTPMSLYDAAQNDYKEGNYESAIRKVVEFRDDNTVHVVLKHKAAHLAVLCHVKLGNDIAIANWRKLCGCSQCLSDLKQREPKQHALDEKEKSAAAEKAAHEAERTKEESRRELKKRRQSALALYAEGKLEACLEALVDIPCDDAEVLELRKKCKDRLNEQAAQIALMNDIKRAHAAFVKKDFKTGFDIAVKYGLAKISDSYVTYHVGYCYSPTYGTEYPNDKDYAKAYEWFCKTAKLEEDLENGDGITECILGDMELAGHGCASNLENAVNWYRRSAARGYWRGCYELGCRYEQNVVNDAADHLVAATNFYFQAMANGGDLKATNAYYRILKDFNLRHARGSALEVAPCDILVMIDGSGSVGKDRFASLCRSIKKGLAMFGSDCRFNLLLFRTTSTIAFDNWQELNNDSLAAASAWLDKQTTHGRTDLMGALERILKLETVDGRKAYVLIITDADDNSTDTLQAKFDRFNSANAGRFKIYTYGIKSECNRQFLVALSNMNDGQCRIFDGWRWKCGDELLKVFEMISEDRIERGTYVVQSGDFLAKISKKFNVTIGSIKRLNPSIKNDVLRVGQKIRIPNNNDSLEDFAATVKTNSVQKPYVPYTGLTREYVVKNGDTLGSVAYGSGMSIRQLKDLNGLSGDSLKIGQRIKIPAKNDGATMTNDDRDPDRQNAREDISGLLKPIK